MVQLSELFAHIDFLLDNIPKLTDQISEQLNAVLIPILVFGVLFFVIALVSIVVCLIFWVKSNKEVAKLVRDEDQNWVETRKPAIGSSYVKSPNKDSLPNSPHNLNHGVTVATTQNPFVTPVVVNSSSTMTERNKTYSQLKLENLRLENRRLHMLLKDSDASYGEAEFERGLHSIAAMPAVASCPNIQSSSTHTFETIVEVNAAMSREDSFYSTAEPVATSTPYAGPLSTTV
ncbi:hypothetical protein QR680_004612 [Steinernema hermaphroditum]|uniref:Uncharacterized protein n=1 Tax=Steinernema hermaphroditum TaxID=289476 RepID=A0AA39LTG5_9BILA|nr:hypothetical protein QR680_004612 [Steinernema hermaphroditum]